MISKTKSHYMRREISKSQAGSTFGQGRQVHLEEVDSEFAVDIVQLELMIVLLIFGIVLRGQLFEIIEIEYTVFIDAFVDVEVLAVLLFDKYMPAVRAYKGTYLKVSLVLVEPEAANLAHVLTSAASVVIEVVMRSIAAMAYCTDSDRVTATRFDRFEIFAMAGFVFGEKNFVVELLRLLNNREFINRELIVLRTCGIVLWGL